MKSGKLVRDKVPEIISNEGKSPVTHTATEKEYWEKLKDKLKEEVNEFAASEEEEELADILEIIHSICDYRKINKKQLELIRVKKARQKGKFKSKIILDDVKFQDI